MNFQPDYGTGKTLSASSTSSRVQLHASAAGGGGRSVYIYNAGPEAAFVRAGDSTVVATTADYPIAPGIAVIVSGGNSTHVAGITSSGTATISAISGQGN